MFCCKLHDKLRHHNLGLVSQKLYIVINAGLGKTICNLCNVPIVLLTLVVITFKFFSKVNWASRNMPRCFWFEVWETMLLLKRKEGWEIFFVFLLKVISWACLLGSGLKLIFHWRDHLLIQYRSLFNSFSEVSTSWFTENKDASSAKNFALDDRSSARSLI